MHKFPITELGSQGDGVHYSERGPIFVEGAIPGDRVRVDVYRDPQGVARGKLLEILEPSSHRIKPPCPHFDECGNCTVQHLKDSYYQRWKVELVRGAFTEQGLRPKKWLDAVFVGKENRRRVTFVLFKKRNTIKMGYYRRRSKMVSEINSCLIAEPILMDLKLQIKLVLEPFLVDGISLDVFLQSVGKAVDMVLTGPLGVTQVPDLAVTGALEKLMRATIIKRITWRANELDIPKMVCCHDLIPAKFGSLKVALPPDAFLQPTVEGENALAAAVTAALPPKGHFADLFAGCGTFSGPMLARGTVEAFESSVPAFNALKKASQGKNLKVFRRDLFRNPVPRGDLDRFDAVVFDPPRAGCLEQARNLAKSKVPVLIGVSCNPATLARDARVLCEGGYTLQTLQVVDQFLWSHHVEAVAVFTKQKKG